VKIKTTGLGREPVKTLDQDAEIPPEIPPTQRPLRGLRVLVTRPKQQAAQLAEHIRRAGGEAVLFPVIEIKEPADPRPLHRLVERLHDYDFALFVSRNAVRGVMHSMGEAQRLPDQLQLAAVGQGTARELAHYGYRVHLRPHAAYHSEALLAMDALQQVRGRRIVIFRGNGGRELLAQTLTQRGAQVDYGEAYRRVQPQDGIERLQTGSLGNIDVITISSNQGLENLVEMARLAQADWIYQTPLVVLSHRAVDLACTLGFATRPMVAREASDKSVVASILRWQQARRESAISSGEANP
jgi:uroporphyrinogen-III synthase